VRSRVVRASASRWRPCPARRPAPGCPLHDLRLHPSAQPAFAAEQERFIRRAPPTKAGRLPPPLSGRARRRERAWTEPIVGGRSPARDILSLWLTPCFLFYHRRTSFASAPSLVGDGRFRADGAGQFFRHQ